MKLHRIMLGATTAAVLVLSSLSSPASGDEDGNAVTEWNEIAVSTLIGLPGPAGGAPPAAAVHVAMVQGAVYDAVNSIGHQHYQPYLLKRHFPGDASKDAAVGTAAYDVLHSIVSTVPNLTDTARATLLATLATQHADFMDAIGDGWSKRKGIAAGDAAAAAMIRARTADGRFGPSQWVPRTTPGHWWPLGDPDAGQVMLDPTPWVGGVKPFAMKSSSQFRTPGPVALSSATWATDFNEVKDIGSATSATRTPEQTYIARWWQSTPVKSWNDVARDLAIGDDLGTTDTARLLAMSNVSGADASINCWNDKYYWDFWRPWNAIRRGAEDGNDATQAQAGWTPLITAPYPDHPSGHLCLDASNTEILEMFFGDAPEGGFQITSVSTLLQPTDARTRTFDSFSGLLAEVVEARIWAGLHYRTADEQGEALGRNVADYVVANYFRPSHHHHHH